MESYKKEVLKMANDFCLMGNPTTAEKVEKAINTSTGYDIAIHRILAIYDSAYDTIKSSFPARNVITAAPYTE